MMINNRSERKITRGWTRARGAVRGGRCQEAKNFSSFDRPPNFSALSFHVQEIREILKSCYIGRYKVVILS